MVQFERPHVGGAAGAEKVKEGKWYLNYPNRYQKA